MSNFHYMRGSNGASGEFSTSGLIDMINSIENSKNMTMIEIGSYIGESTIIFAEHFKNVISIDPHLDYSEINSDNYPKFSLVYEEFIKNISKYDNVKHIRKSSDEAVVDILEKVDFVYIDGLHTYDQVVKDITNYRNVIKEGGILGGHDYNFIPSVTKAVDDILGSPEYIFKDFSWYTRKF